MRRRRRTVRLVRLKKPRTRRLDPERIRKLLGAEKGIPIPKSMRHFPGSLGIPRYVAQMRNEGPFVVVIEHPKTNAPMFMMRDEDRPARFISRRAAREGARGALWENKWVWWIVCLEPKGTVLLGTDDRNG